MSKWTVKIKKKSLKIQTRLFKLELEEYNIIPRILIYYNLIKH